MPLKTGGGIPFEDLPAICAIELGDGSHQSKRWIFRWGFWSGRFSAVQVPAKSCYFMPERKPI